MLINLISTITACCIHRVAALLEAKGGGRKGRFQGKAAKIEGRNEVSQLLKEEYTDDSQ